MRAFIVLELPVTLHNGLRLPLGRSIVMLRKGASNSGLRQKILPLDSNMAAY